MNIEDTIEDKLDQIIKNQSKLERLLLTITPFRRLPADLQRRAAELQNECVGMMVKDSGERGAALRRTFAKLEATNPGAKKAAKWPGILMPRLVPGKEGIMARGGVLGAVPLSALLNRCVSRKCFELAPGDVSVRDNIMKEIERAGWKIQTMHDAGLVPGSRLPLVVAGSWRWQHGPPEGGEGVIVQETQKEEPEVETVPEDSIFNTKRVLSDDDDEPEEKPVRKKRVFAPAPEDEEPPAWGGIDLGDDEEEEFETSECAQGVATMGVVDDDDIVDEDEDEPVDPVEKELASNDNYLSTTTNPVDDDNDGWGPDEHEFSNPIREQFEREAEEAWAREQAALASGELVLVDGIPVARKK